MGEGLDFVSREFLRVELDRVAAKGPGTAGDVRVELFGDVRQAWLASFLGLIRLISHEPVLVVDVFPHMVVRDVGDLLAHVFQPRIVQVEIGPALHVGSERRHLVPVDIVVGGGRKLYDVVRKDRQVLFRQVGAVRRNELRRVLDRRLAEIDAKLLHCAADKALCSVGVEASAFCGLPVVNRDLDGGNKIYDR